MGRTPEQQEPRAQKILHGGWKVEQGGMPSLSQPFPSFLIPSDASVRDGALRPPLREATTQIQSEFSVNLSENTPTDTLVYITDLLEDSWSSQVDIEDQHLAQHMEGVNGRLTWSSIVSSFGDIFSVEWTVQYTEWEAQKHGKRIP